MVIVCSLSHSWQLKTILQGAIEDSVQVSDETECVMSMWPIPYLVCVSCVQKIAEFQKQLSEPYLSSRRKEDLHGWIKMRETRINRIKRNIFKLEEEIKERQLTLRQLVCKFRDRAHSY